MKELSPGTRPILRTTARWGLLPLLLLWAIAGHAQTYRGTVRGQVRDASGSVLVGAQVKARNTATAHTGAAITADDGGYVIPELPAGEYEVTVEAKDLAPVTLHVIVNVGADTSLDFTLAKVASAATQITVTATAPLVDTSRDVLGQIVEQRLVIELPLNGRDFGKLVALVPGVAVEGSGVAGTEKGTGQFNINGARDRSNNYTLDGTDNNDPFHNNSALNQVGISGAPASLLPIDAIQEFNLQAQFPAEYGRNSGSVVNIITKSGTNELHGSLFEYHRNSYFDARNFFNVQPNAQTHFVNNQFGASLGGPVVHDKVFFFAAYEGQRERVGSDFVFFVPTAADRAKAQMVATTFARNNKLGTINTAPTDAILARFFPVSTNRMLNSSVQDMNDLDSFILKSDVQLTPTHLFSARYAFGSSTQEFPFGSLGGFGSGSRLAPFANQSPTRVQLVSLSLLSTLGPSRVNEIRFGYTRFRASFRSIDDTFNPSSVGLNLGTSKPGLPEFDFGAILDNLGASAFGLPRGRVSQNYQILDNYTWIHGLHTIKFGGEFRRVSVNSFNDNLERGLFSFSTSGLDPDPVIDILANYYLGNAFVQGNTGNTHRNTFNNGTSFFGQDDYRIRPNLTLNLGLRWEYFGPMTEKNNLLSGLDANENLVQVGTLGLPRLYDRDLDNFGPRFGLAWSPSAKTVVRSGYGIYYDYIPQDILLDSFTASAGVSTNPVGPAATAVFPLNFNQSAFNGSAPSGTPILTVSTAPPFNVFIADRHLKTPYMQTWNLNIQHEVRQNAGVEIGYVGSKGTHLVRLRDANQPDASGSHPNSQFGFEDVFSSTSNSTYHALQGIARIQAWHRFAGFASYVFSKSLDDASDGIDFNFASAALPQDSNNIRAEHGPSTFDTRHRFTGAINYQVPAWDALPKKLAEGWQLNTIVTAQSGRPIPIVTSNDTSGQSNFHQRPNIVPGVNPILPNFDPTTGYLNPAAFAQPLPGTFGNLGRNAIFGPGIWNVDFSATKNTNLTERLVMQFRAEFFNVFNHPQFALPVNTINPGSSPAGQIVATPDVAQGNPGLGGGGPRVLQFALRVTF
jgi:hypothetical protein